MKKMSFFMMSKKSMAKAQIKILKKTKILKNLNHGYLHRLNTQNRFLQISQFRKIS